MKTTLAILTLATIALSSAHAQEMPSINKRGTKNSDEEKKFITDLTAAIVKAAHPTAKSPTWTKYEYSQPKERRSALTIILEFKGGISGATYKADAVVTFDTADPKSWEVLSIDFKDKNDIIPANKDKIAELVKRLNERK